MLIGFTMVADALVVSMLLGVARVGHFAPFNVVVQCRRAPSSISTVTRRPTFSTALTHPFFCIGSGSSPFCACCGNSTYVRVSLTALWGGVVNLNTVVVVMSFMVPYCSAVMAAVAAAAAAAVPAALVVAATTAAPSSLFGSGRVPHTSPPGTPRCIYR